MSDAIMTYRRILKSASRGVGTRLTAEECFAISRDDAVTQAIRSTDEYETETESQPKSGGN